MAKMRFKLIIKTLFLGQFIKLAISEAILNNMPAYNPGSDAAISPRFITESKRFQVILGDSIVMPCEVTNLGPFVVVWRRGSSILTAGRLLVTRDSRFALQGGGGLHALQLSGARLDDQGEYTCQIGDGGAEDLIHHLEILIPPSLQVSPPTGQVTARRGGSVSFECKATGNPIPSIHWIKKDGILPSGLQIENGYLLTWNDVQRQHAGIYTCTASNGIGQAVHADVHLHVLYPPEVNVLRSWVNAGEGLEAKLDCIVHADPPAEVLWYQDSFALQPTDRRFMTHSGKKHSLTIKNIQISDFGNYSCVVVNSIGKDKRYIELSGKPGPAIVISSGISGPHEYMIKWNVQSVFPIIEVRILYRRLLFNTSYQHASKWHDVVAQPRQSHFSAASSERTYVHRLAGLSPDSVYECMLQCRNQNGWGELSDMHQWFTKRRGAAAPGVHAEARAATHSASLPVLLGLLLCAAR